MYTEVAFLAKEFNWTEEYILSLTKLKRDMYVKVVSDTNKSKEDKDAEVSSDLDFIEWGDIR